MAETVCPRCVVFSASRFCGECGSETRPGNYCTKCTNICPTGTRFCGECGGPIFKAAVESRGANKPNPNAPRNPANPKVDSSSLFDTVSPSAVFKGVSGGLEDNLSKYRINPNEAVNQDIDWKQTLRAASRANVDDDNDVTAVESPEPAVVHNPHTTQVYTRPDHTPPSQQMRREDVWGQRGNTHNQNVAPPGATQYRPPQQSNVQIRAPANQNPVPPGRAYPPGGVYNTRSVGVTVEESTIRPSLLRDSSDPLEKYRIKDGNTDAASQISQQPQTVFSRETADPLQKYRAKTPEEEERTWNIYLFNLQADPDKPVELYCDGHLVYAGDGVNGNVNTRVVYQAQGPSTAVTLNIKSMSFNLTKNLEIAKGRFIKFSIEQDQLKFRHQRTEID